MIFIIYILNVFILIPLSKNHNYKKYSITHRKLHYT